MNRSISITNFFQLCGFLYEIKFKTQQLVNLFSHPPNKTKGITVKLLDENRVKIELFQNNRYEDYTIEKDRAVNSGVGTHGGSYWKIKKDGERIVWTLDINGNVLRRKPKS